MNIITALLAIAATLCATLTSINDVSIVFTACATTAWLHTLRELLPSTEKMPATLSVVVITACSMLFGLAIHLQNEANTHHRQAAPISQR